MKGINIYNIRAVTIDGEEITLDKYKGKTLLIVNTASYCGYTNQFKGLQSLYEQYSKYGFEILGFPCNQFGNQDPDSEEKIKGFCQINYGVSFQMFAKVDINGPNTHPLFAFLKQKKSGFLSDDIKWNFTKFLVNQQGKVIKRFSPATTPEKIIKHIEKIIKTGK